MQTETNPPPKIHSAMIAIMRDLSAIGKNEKNAQQGFFFRGIDTLYNELHDVLAKHGVFMLPSAGQPTCEERTTAKGGVLRFVQVPMTYTFMADDGSCVSCTVIGEGMDSGDKATNKAMAIAHKYALLQTFLIPTEERIDPDYESHEITAREEKRQELAKATSAEQMRAKKAPWGKIEMHRGPHTGCKLYEIPVENRRQYLRKLEELETRDETDNAVMEALKQSIEQP